MPRPPFLDSGLPLAPPLPPGAKAPLILYGQQARDGLSLSSLEQGEQEIFDEDYGGIVRQAYDLDPQLAQLWLDNYYGYLWCIQQFKNALGGIKFGGSRPTSGQFGFRVFTPQDGASSAVTDASPPSTDVRTWRQSMAVNANTTIQSLFPNVKGTLAVGTNTTGTGAGIAANTVSPNQTQPSRAVHAFHGFISWNPGTRIVAYRLVVNSIVYPVFNAEHFAKTQKPLKPHRIIPLPNGNRAAGGVAYTGLNGDWRLDAIWDLEDGTYASGFTVIEEIGVLGLVLAEYTFLNTLMGG